VTKVSVLGYGITASLALMTFVVIVLELMGM
jgi:hypothetical protein